MALSAYFVEDPITRIVSITIQPQQGAVVAFNQDGPDPFSIGKKVYRGIPDPTPTPEEPPQLWEEVSSPSTLAAYGQSYALIHKLGDPPDMLTPTFIMGGTDNAASYIYYSNDGLDWSVVFTIPTARLESVPRGNGFTGIVWHPVDLKFYAILEIIQAADVGAVLNSAQIFSSPDGIAWSAGDKFSIFEDHPGSSSEAFDEWINNSTAAFKALCTKPENRGGIPDGYQAYDAASEIFMKPTALLDWDTRGPRHNITVGVDGGITIEGATGTTSSPPGFVWAVSFAGRVWNALTWDVFGSAPGVFVLDTEVYASLDNGQTWRHTFHSTTGGNPGGLIAAKAADIRSD